MDAPPTSIDEPRPHGHFEISIRLGYGHPMGELTTSRDLRESISRQIPLWLEASYRFASGVSLGAYVSYGIVAVADGSPACPAGWSACRGSDVRFGILLLDHRRPGKAVDPWFGIGLGKEWLSYHAKLEPAGGLATGAVTDTLTYSGWDLSFHVGLDLRVTRAFTLGPFATLALVGFDTRQVERSGAVSVSPPEQDLSGSLHEWLFVGARGTFGFF